MGEISAIRDGHEIAASCSPGSEETPIADDMRSVAGVTRGKRLVVLLGQKKAVAIAVKNVSGRRRWSKLREWLSPI
jgi:hypothetical protein